MKTKGLKRIILKSRLNGLEAKANELSRVRVAQQERIAMLESAIEATIAQYTEDKESWISFAYACMNGWKPQGVQSRNVGFAAYAEDLHD
jgi:hypothetical protein